MAKPARRKMLSGTDGDLAVRRSVTHRELSLEDMGFESAVDGRPAGLEVRSVWHDTERSSAQLPSLGSPDRHRQLDPSILERDLARGASARGTAADPTSAPHTKNATGGERGHDVVRAPGHRPHPGTAGRLHSRLLERAPVPLAQSRGSRVDCPSERAESFARAFGLQCVTVRQGDAAERPFRPGRSVNQRHEGDIGRVQRASLPSCIMTRWLPLLLSILDPLAPCRLPPTLAMEIALRQPVRWWSLRGDEATPPPDDRCQRGLGRGQNSRRIAEARHRHRRANRVPLHAAQATEAAFAKRGAPSSKTTSARWRRSSRPSPMTRRPGSWSATATAFRRPVPPPRPGPHRTRLKCRTYCRATFSRCWSSSRST